MNNMAQPPHDLSSLTGLLRAAWATITAGEAIIATSEALEEASADEELEDDITPGPRLRTAWAHRALGEDEVVAGEALEARVGVLADKAGIELEAILGALADLNGIERMPRRDH